MRILFIHGVGHMDDNHWWHDVWQNAVENAIGKKITPEFMEYDLLFSANGAPTGRDYLKALLMLLTCRRKPKASGGEHDEQEGGPVSQQIRWRAGMVAEFLTDEGMKRQWRKNFAALLKEFKPDVVYAHSLGTLLTYDFLMDPEYKNNNYNWVYMTAASQLCHDKMSNIFPRPLEMPKVKHWININNPNDLVLADEPLQVKMVNGHTFEQFIVPWKALILFNHDEPGYIVHASKTTDVWKRLAQLI